MKVQELRQLTPKKVQEELKKVERELVIARFHVKTGQNQNIAQLAKLKKSVAQMKTLLTAHPVIKEIKEAAPKKAVVSKK